MSRKGSKYTEYEESADFFLSIFSLSLFVKEDNMGGAISGFDILCLFLSKTVPHLGKNETVLMKEME